MSYHILVPAAIARPFLRTLNRLKDLGTLLARLWIAKIFFAGFLTKIAYWPGTIIVFQYRYHVPFMSPVTAAYIGTWAEFTLPILLVLGLGGRIVTFMFFVYNIMCIVAFPYLWTANGSAGLADHISWGLLLMLVMLHGSGRISIDHILHKKFGFLIEKASWAEAKEQFHLRRKNKGVQA